MTASGGPACRIVTIRTSGDRLQSAPLSEIGGKRLFVKEIEDALLQDEVDLAVHSSKDLPAILPDGLMIAGTLPREDPRDVIVLPFRDPGMPGTGSRLEPALSTLDDLVASLGSTPLVGTSSVRRIAQLARLVPAARFAPLRGNLETRLRKLDAGEYDALVLAAAGLRRLGFASRISFALPPSACVPAPGQGIVAIEVREGDADIRRLIAKCDDQAAAAALDAERALVTALGGGCQTPIGALASPLEHDGLELVATVMSLDGTRMIRRHARGNRSDAVALGTRVAADLIEDGAGEILEEIGRLSAVDHQQSTED